MSKADSDSATAQGALAHARGKRSRTVIKTVGGAARGNKRIAEQARSGLVIRDSFTMPVADYALIGALKQRCLSLGIAMKKSELLRAGLATLQRLPDESLEQVVAAIESVKTGRPPGRARKKQRSKDGKQ